MVKLAGRQGSEILDMYQVCRLQQFVECEPAGNRRNASQLQLIAK